MKRLRESGADYTLNVNTIERWQENSGVKNRKVIREWAKAKRELVNVDQLLKSKKAELANELQDRKESGEKITDKVVDAIIKGNKEVLELEEEKELLNIDIDELYQIMLLFRDMWTNAPTLRQSVNNLEKFERDSER